MEEVNLDHQALVEAQRKLIVGDCVLVRDYKKIARQAATLLKDRCWPDDVKSLLDSGGFDIDEETIDRILSLESKAKQGDAQAMAELAQEVSVFLSDAEYAASTHHFWVAKAALADNGRAYGQLGMIFEGYENDLGGGYEIFSSEYDEDALREDKLISTACYLQSVDCEDWDSFAALGLADQYLLFHNGVVGFVPRNFDVGMELLERLIKRNNELNRSVINDQWAHQAPYWLKQYVELAPPESDSAWNDCEYPYIFGLYYEYGCGGKIDLEKALEYFGRGMVYNHNLSVKHMKAIEQRIQNRDNHG